MKAYGLKALYPETSKTFSRSLEKFARLMKYIFDKTAEIQYLY